MNWVLILMLTAIATPQFPVERANRLNTQGALAAGRGEYGEARRLYEESIAFWRFQGPGYDAHRAGTLLNLAITMSDSGQGAAAVPIASEALALHRRTLGSTHLRTLTNINVLANTLLTLGEADRAEALFREALPVVRERYPRDPALATTLEGIAYFAIRRKQPAEALPLAEEALAIVTPATGENSMDAALAYSVVAEAHRAMGAGARALPLYRRARFLYEKQFGPEHPRVVSILSQEGLILMEDGKLSLAEKAMARAATALEQSCRECLVELAIAETNLGVLRMKQGRFRDADAALTRAVELREKTAAKPGTELADVLQLLAGARQKERLFEDAARLNSRAALIRAYR